MRKKKFLFFLKKKTRKTEPKFNISFHKWKNFILYAFVRSILATGCPYTAQGSIALQNQTTPTTWTAYTHSFTASSATPTLLFGFQLDGSNSFYLDNVSVIDTTLSSSELLSNPNFENSTTTVTGWILSCEATSCGHEADRITNNSEWNDQT